jgi:hypothetical protein
MSEYALISPFLYTAFHFPIFLNNARHIPLPYDSYAKISMSMWDIICGIFNIFDLFTDLRDTGYESIPDWVVSTDVQDF